MFTGIVQAVGAVKSFAVRTRSTPTNRSKSRIPARIAYTPPSARNATGSIVSAMSTSVYHTIWFIVSRSPQTSGAIGIRALA